MPNRACTSRCLAAAISTQPKCHVAVTTVVAQHCGRIVVDPRGHEREQYEDDQAQGDQRRVDRAAALAGPVDIVEVEPQGVLVDGEADGDAEEDRVDRVPETVGLP